MKIVFEFVSTNVLSGLENVVINICTLIRGCKFIYVSPNGPIDEFLRKYNIKHVAVSKITPLSVRRIIKKYSPDIVHGHDVKASLALACNSYLCHKMNIKIISELHNDDPRMWRYSLRAILYALSSPFYDKIIVISNSIISHYIFSPFIINKTIVIPNSINIYRINRKCLMNNTKKKWDCIFIGRLVDQKNPIKFVYIINSLKKKYKNITAVILGCGNLYKKLHDLIIKLKLLKNIKIIGFKNNPYIYLRMSKVCVMPSKYEGFGLVALESLLLGVPVICSYTGGLRNIVNIQCGNFSNSIDDYVNNIMLLLTNNDIYKLKSKNCVKRANKINKLERFINRYYEVYRS